MLLRDIGIEFNPEARPILNGEVAVLEDGSFVNDAILSALMASRRRDTIRQMRMFVSLLLLSAACLPAQKADFARHIRPILSDRCFACHGPDEATRKAGLRLDTEEGAKAARGKRVPVIPGNAAASEVIKRINAANEAFRMPPAQCGPVFRVRAVCLHLHVMTPNAITSS